MFRSIANLVSKLASSRTALAAAPLALAAMAVPMMGAGPWYWHYPSRHLAVVVRPDPLVVFSAPAVTPVVVAPVPVDVMPDGLTFTAYQSRDTIMLFASGSNRTGGFATALRTIDVRDAFAHVQLCNTAPCGPAVQAISPFSTSAALHVDRPLSSMEVRVAGQVMSVPVVQVASIS